MGFIYKILLSSCAIINLCCSDNPQVLQVGDEPDLIPEGIACSSGTGYIYLSSYHKRKLVEFDPASGTVTDFLGSGEHGYLQGTGLEIQDSLLFALSSEKKMGRATSKLQVFRLASRDLLYEFAPPDSLGGFWNDLAIGTKNQIYITDTQNHLVWRLEYPYGKPEIFLEHIELRYPNGITISADKRRLYIASWSHGIRVVDAASGDVLNEHHMATMQLGIDGLKYKDGKLYAIKNGSRDKKNHAMLRIALTAQETQLGRIDTVLMNHPSMNVPTTFCIVDKSAYILANSQLEMLDQENNRIRHMDSLTPTYLIKIKL